MKILYTRGRSDHISGDLQSSSTKLIRKRSARLICVSASHIHNISHPHTHTRRSQRTFIASLLSRRRFEACGWSEKQSKKKVKQGEKHTSAAAERDIQVKQLNYRRKKNLSTYPARTDDAVEFAAAAATQPIQ